MTQTTQTTKGEMMTTTIDLHDGKSIRRALKAELGYNARQVSVRVENYSMGGCCHFTIRDASVSYETVKQFASECERVRRCEITGEILNGGNRYSDVHIAPAVAEAWAAPYAEKIAAAYEKLNDGDTHGELIDGTDLIVWNGQWQGQFYVSLRGEQTRCPYRPACEDGFKRSAIDAYLMLNS